MRFDSDLTGRIWARVFAWVGLRIDGLVLHWRIVCLVTGATGVFSALSGHARGQDFAPLPLWGAALLFAVWNATVCTMVVAVLHALARGRLGRALLMAVVWPAGVAYAVRTAREMRRVRSSPKEPA